MAIVRICAFIALFAFQGVLQPVNHLGVLVREPMLVEHPNGMLFVAGYRTGPVTLWRSADGGSTWTAVDVAAPAGMLGDSDVDLALDSEGRLYFATMTFDRVRAEGTQISVGVSDDAGKTWHWNVVSKARFDDRPWVKVAPSGTAHVIWNDGNGVRHAVSTNRGRAWSDRGRIHDAGGSSHLAIGPRGEVAVRIIPFSASAFKTHPGVDLIAISEGGDEGTTWVKHPAPGRREWRERPGLHDDTNPLPRWVEPIAWDASGALYSMWTDLEGLWLARSQDRGRSWSTWRIAAGGAVRYYPYLSARGSGELAATWIAGRGDALTAHVARFQLQDDAPPRIVHSASFVPDSWRLRAPGAREVAGEYLPVAFLRNGDLGVVSPIQNPAEKRFGFAWWRIKR